MLSPLERSQLLKIDVFASSQIVLSPMEIATFSKTAFLHYSEFVLSPMEITTFLKMHRLLILHCSEFVLSPMEIAILLKIIDFCLRTSCHAEFSKIVSSPMVRTRFLRFELRA